MVNSCTQCSFQHLSLSVKCWKQPSLQRCDMFVDLCALLRDQYLFSLCFPVAFITVVSGHLIMKVLIFTTPLWDRKGLLSPFYRGGTEEICGRAKSIAQLSWVLVQCLNQKIILPVCSLWSICVSGGFAVQVTEQASCCQEPGIRAHFSSICVP